MVYHPTGHFTGRMSAQAIGHNQQRIDTRGTSIADQIGMVVLVAGPGPPRVGGTVDPYPCHHQLVCPCLGFPLGLGLKNVAPVFEPPAA